MSVGNILVQGVAFLVILLLLVLTALGTWIVPGPEPVYLKGGPRFEQDITADAIAALVASRGMASPPQRTYFVAQYERPLTPSERTRLASQIDVEFLDAIPANAYIVSVPTVGGGPVMQRLFLSDPAARTLVDIKEKDKLSQQLYFVDPNTGLLVEDIPAGISYIQSPGVLGATNLAMFVRFYADVPLARQRELLKDYTDDDEDEHVDATAPSFGLWTVMVPAGSLVALAELPEVQSIEPGLPPLVNDMDVAGPWVGAAASVVETGSGVRMGQWEKCMPDNSHADLGNVIKMDVDSVLCENGSNDHATMVAGAIVADGSTFSNYPGIAPDAEILAFDVNSFPSEIIDEYVTALLLGTTLTNSSFGFEIDDLFFEVMSEPHLWYRTMNGHYDRVTSARTASGEMIATGRKITVVASTGNRGDDAWWSGTRVRNSAKNVITVGGISTGPDAANNAPMSQGGRGPTGDGRLSPLLVAPSIEYKPDDWGIKSSFPGNGQGQSWGTSFSTPIVSGVAALASEKFVAKCGGGPPAPADLRAVLVHTAEDLTDAGMEVFGLDNPEGNPPMRSKMQSSASIHPEVNPVLQYIGPDFIFGYGLVKANKAVEIIADLASSGTRLNRGSSTIQSTSIMIRSTTESVSGLPSHGTTHRSRILAAFHRHPRVSCRTTWTSSSLTLMASATIRGFWTKTPRVRSQPKVRLKMISMPARSNVTNATRLNRSILRSQRRHSVIRGLSRCGEQTCYSDRRTLRSLARRLSQQLPAVKYRALSIFSHHSRRTARSSFAC